MSNSLAMAASTATLRNLLMGVNNQVAGTTVTTKPPDKARNGGTGNQLNLFLYHAMPNAAWRNQPLSEDGHPSRDGFAPLALNLLYFVTAYGQNDDEIQSHHLLGEAMRILHDNPVLNRSQVEAALPNNDLHEQIERVRITPTTVSAEEISKWWTTFQTQYRITATYQVSVVLIESARKKPTPLPILKRGLDDHGGSVVAGEPPKLEGFQLPSNKPTLELGDDLLIKSRGLGDQVELRWHHAKLDQPLVLIPQVDPKGRTLKVHVPNTAEEPTVMKELAPGPFNVGAVLRLTGVPPFTTNELPIGLAPIITVKPLATQAGTLSLTVTSSPRIRSGQRVSLIVGGQQMTVKEQHMTNPQDTTKPTSIKVTIPGMKKGAYVIRLRVDGIESNPMRETSTGSWEFDPNQTVTVT